MLGSGNTIGGTSAGARNLISSNDGGVIIGGTGNIVEGNYIGTDVTGSAALGNSFDGVTISYPSSHNLIGGTTGGSGNVIAFNGRNGVTVGFFSNENSQRNAIRGNSIFSNGALGIDLANDGVTKNDDGDPDGGPNELQNFPRVKSATSATLKIKGKLNSTPNTQFTLEFFSNTACDGTNHGEGKNFWARCR